MSSTSDGSDTSPRRASAYGAYEAVIGLEVHAQLLTRTKAFCACATSFGDAPNTHTCPVCLGLPGALPVLSDEAVHMAASAALALGCQIRKESVFARKNYFYPDLPKGYQISQYDQPLAVHGAIEIETDAGKRRARILRVHMEEDAGKTLHAGDESVVDLNRAGTPLIEIVGEPDLRSGAEAAEYLKRLREILMFVGVNDGNLEQGSFRCDANVSVRKAGEALGTRTELKNINSFRFVADAIDVEARRQIALLEGGERVRQETRGYNADKRETYLLRDKENEAGYRYFPEPDLPPLTLEPDFVRDVRDALPEGPVERRRRYVEELGLTPQAALVLTGHPEIASFFETTVRLAAARGDGKGFALRAANFIQSEVLRDLRTSGLGADLPASPAQIAELLRAVEGGTISGKQAKEVYALMRGTATFPDAIIRERGMGVVSDEGTLVALATDLVAKNPKQAEAYRGGKTALLGFFVGLVMKATRGSADPAAVNRVLKRVLGGEPEPSLEALPAHAAGVSPPTAGLGGAIADAGSSETVTAKAARDEPEERSPLAESVPPPPPVGVGHRERTLTSASAAEALLASLPTGADGGPSVAEAFARVDLRVGRVLLAAAVPDADALLDLAVDVGEPRPVRVVQALGARALLEIVGKRVLVARVHGGIEAQLLVAGPADLPALVTVSEDAAPGTVVTTGRGSPPSSRPEPSSLEGAGSRE